MNDDMLTNEDLVVLALSGIRAQISDLQAKERLLAAQLRLRQWGKPKRLKFVSHDAPGLPDVTRETIARTHAVQGTALLEQKERKKRRRKMSAAGRKAISEAAKRRWAKVRAAGKKR